MQGTVEREGGGDGGRKNGESRPCQGLAIATLSRYPIIDLAFSARAYDLHRKETL